jgi:hypothetical protein
MNADDSTAPDYALASSTGNYGSTFTPNVELLVRDYGGYTRVTASHAGAVAELRLPNDGNANRLPESGWRATSGHVSDSGGSESDDLESGGGANGDGLTAWEEYRGFVVQGQHARLHPEKKDLFIHSTVPEGVGDAVDYGGEIHSIDAQEMGPAEQINMNFMNGSTGDPAHFVQRALRIVPGGYKQNQQGAPIAGEVEIRNSGSVIPPYYSPANTRIIRVFEQSIRFSSPTNNDRYIVDTPDYEKTLQTLGHEVGHALNLADRDALGSCTPGSWTVMLTNYFNVTINSSDCHWLNIPHEYTAQEKALMRLR